MITVEKKTILTAPFPWFGGKSKAAALVWSRLGSDLSMYYEPFFGSGAVLLNAPPESKFCATVNDIDGHVCNFWRSVQLHPDEVAYHADQQVNELDLHARHQYLVDNRDKLTEKLRTDPFYCDPILAGWWAWGCASWIGSNWCKPRKRTTQQLPHLSDKGQGLNRVLPKIFNTRQEFLLDWLGQLQTAIGEARIVCGDWARIATPSVMTKKGLCGVLLDPPYGTTKSVYAIDCNQVAYEVLEWCIENGNNPKMRIALCGHVGQHEKLEDLGWEVVKVKKPGGYQGAEGRERIWFSPHCVKPDPLQGALLRLAKSF